MPDGRNVAASIFSPGAFSSLSQFAERYTEEFADIGTGILGQKGLLESSFLPAVIDDAYSRGMSLATGLYQQEQSRQDQWSMFLAQLELQEDMVEDDGGFDWLGIGASAGAGALAGMAAQNPYGPAIGAAIGGGTALLGEIFG